MGTVMESAPGAIVCSAMINRFCLVGLRNAIHSLYTVWYVPKLAAGATAATATSAIELLCNTVCNTITQATKDKHMTLYI